MTALEERILNVIERNSRVGINELAILLGTEEIEVANALKKMEDDGFPSKVYTIMACNRPLLVMSGEHTPIVNFLSDKHCAKLITDRSVDEMVDWMRQLTRAELQEMGKNGLETIRKHYTKEIVTRQYADLVGDLLGA